MGSSGAGSVTPSGGPLTLFIGPPGGAGTPPWMSPLFNIPLYYLTLTLTLPLTLTLTLTLTLLSGGPYAVPDTGSPLAICSGCLGLWTP
jgi:hypothetical protein